MNEYSEFVLSLKRLYSDRTKPSVDINKIKSLLATKKITQDEYQFIIKKEA